MKQKYFLRIAFCFLLFSNISYGQLVTTIDFETENSGYSVSSTTGSGFTDVFNRSNSSLTNVTNEDGFFWAVEDFPNGFTNPSITLDQINITGSNSFTFSIDMTSHHYDDWDTADELLITYSIDGGSYQNLMWVQSTEDGTAFNEPAALDTNFDGTGDCSAENTLPALSPGTGDGGCVVSSSNFKTFTTNSITLSGNTTLDIKLQFNGFTSGDEGIYIDNIVITETTASSDPTVTFDSSSSSETETDATFATSGIPITLTNYNADVTITPSVNLGSTTAEVGDYTLDLTPLVFDANETLNIPLSINPDTGSDNETLVIDIAVSSGTADLGTSQHIITITDDELPNLVINEFQADPDASSGDANGDGSVNTSQDEFIEIYNASGGVLDISDYTINDSVGLRHTFPKGTIIPAGAVIVVFGGGTPTNIPCLTQVASVGYLGLNNGGDTIIIKDDSSTTITSYTYGSEGGDNQSVARGTDLTGSFVEHSTIGGNSVLFSPGRRNADNIPFSKSWTGSSDNDWTNSSNWDTNSSPSSVSDNVWISSGLSNYPTASGAVTVNSVTINSGASLIAQGTFTGTVTYNRNIPTTNWYLVSSPVVGQDIDAFVATEGLASGTGNNIGLGDYNNTTPEWEYYQNGASGTGNFISGDGRAVLLSATGNITFTGTLNTSDVNISITDGTGSGGSAFNLVGNPYPSFIAANNNADGTNNILKVNDTDNDYLTESTIWFWNQGTSSYDQINHASAAKYIAPGQGFFLSANGSNSLSITEAMQSHQGTDSFQRLTTRPEIELTLSNGTAIRNAEIYYIEGTTTGWNNGYDSSIFGGVANEFAIYTHAVANGNGRDLGIQSLPNNDFENMIIPVGINAEAGTAITIDAATNNFPEGINIYLEDKQENSFTLLDIDSNFSSTLESSLSGIGRFYLHTTSSVLSAADFDINTNISLYTSGNNNLRIVGVQKGAASVQMYNILGREVFKTSFEGNGVNDISLNTIPTGIYIVKLTTENGTLNRKIIIQY